MKLKYILGLVLLGLGFSISAKCQVPGYGPTLSYQYLKGSTVKIGGYLLQDVGFNSAYKIDLTGNLTWTQGKFAVIPEVAGSYYFGNSNAMNVGLLFLRAEVTPYTVTPKVGFSLLTLFDVDFGYGLSIQHKKNYEPIEGFAASVRFNIPLNLGLF